MKKDLKSFPNSKDIIDKLNLHFGRKITKGEAITLHKIVKEYGKQFIYDIIDKLDKDSSVLYGPLREQIHIICQANKIELNIDDTFKSRKIPMEDIKLTFKRPKKSL